jgi:hypothetical protein
MALTGSVLMGTLFCISLTGSVLMGTFLGTSSSRYTTLDNLTDVLTGSVLMGTLTNALYDNGVGALLHTLIGSLTNILTIEQMHIITIAPMHTLTDVLKATRIGTPPQLLEGLASIVKPLKQLDINVRIGFKIHHINLSSDFKIHHINLSVRV